MGGGAANSFAFSFFTEYRLTPRFELGGGGQYASSRLAQNVPPIKSVPGYWTFDAMAKYAPGTAPSGGHMLGWASAKVFELAASQLPEPPTSAAILEALQSIHGDPLPDIAGPLLYNPGAPATPSACAFATIIRNQSWTSDGKRPCVG